MSRTRHTVERVRPEISHSFDQQFWPVLMAIIVLGSIAAGAIVTLVRGPWMWGSLLILPAAAGATILCLYRLNDSLLRRSLQFAILLSCAAHLLILIMTSLTVIFGNDLQQRKEVVARTPQRSIVISNKAKRFVFEQPQKHSVTEAKVEPNKRQTTTTKSQPQPIPVPVQRPEHQQQVVKREREQSTVPRVEKQLSKRSRNVQQVKPRVARAVTEPSKSAKKQQLAKSKPNAEPAETDLQRQVMARRSNGKTESPASSLKSRQPKPLASRRATKAGQISQRKESTAARIKRPDAQIPKVALKVRESGKSSKPQPTASPTPTVARTEPTSANVVKKRVAQSASRKTSSQIETTNRPVVKSATSRTERQQITIQSNIRATETQRQSVSRVPNTRVLPNQDVQSSSASAATQRTPLQPQQVAITRSSIGSVGVGRSKNVERGIGGQASPVKLSSSSSARRQSNRVSENIALSSLQQSPRRERGHSEKSSRVLRKQNVKWARRTGAAQPAEATLQAAAASIDSARANLAGRKAAEKGQSMIDLGPTKVVAEATSDRRGGGGLPELSSALVNSSSAASGRKSNQFPTVSKELTSEQFPATAAVASSALVADANDQAGELNRQMAQSTNSATRGKTSLAAPSSAETSVTDLLAGAASERRQDASSESSLMDNVTAEVAEPGFARSRIPKAPSVDAEVNYGSQGQTESLVVEADSDGVDSATAEMIRRASDSVTGGSLMGTATKIVASSMAGLPMIGDGAGQSRRISDREAVLEGEDRSNATSRSASENMPNVQQNLPVQPIAADSSEANTISGVVELDTQAGTIQRRALQANAIMPSAEVELDASDGVGGLAEVVSRRVGSVADSITDDRALSLSRDARFRRSEFGGAPSVVPDAAIAKEAFRSRNPAALADAGPKTEAAIELGLEFLTRYQLSDGSWTLGQFDAEDPLFQNQLNSDTAATGLALLAFQGAGYNHRQYKYANQLKLAVDWLVSNQDDTGGLYVSTDKKSNEACLMYSHAIAALALTEAYGMTQDPELKQPTQRALDYIAKTQHAKKGGWRYFEDRRRSTDTSVTGWMMMALKSGRLAGLEVDDEVLEKIDRWLDVAEDPNAKSQFRYNPYAVDTAEKSRAHGRKASTTMTSVGLLMRVYTGWGPTDSRFLRGTDAILKQLPGDQNSRVRDTYYWYYATQVMKHAGGDRWEQWNGRLQPLLVGTQETSGPYRGSWHPFKPVPDRWGPQGGRLFVTTMNLLSLEVKYRLLPLYENTIK